MIENGFVHRKYLIQKCKAILNGGVGIFVAPAGYGKTVFIKQWLHENQISAIWLNLSTRDNEIKTFIKNIKSSINSANEDAALIKSNNSNQFRVSNKDNISRQLHSIFMNQKQRLALVIDDFQKLYNLEINEIIEDLIHNLPSNSIVLLLSRNDPSINFGKVHLRKKIITIQKESLAFSLEEAELFFESFPNLEISPRGIRKIHKKTEGWPAGFQLIKHTLESTVLHEEDLFLFETPIIQDYLLEEVFKVQPESIKQFLVKSSLLEVFSPELCDYVFVTDDSFELISRLERNHIFVEKIENRKNWYRYHNLFADLLKEQRHTIPSEEATAIIFRAAEWYEKNWFWKEALEFFHKSNEYSKFIALLSDHIDEIFIQGGYSQIKVWLDTIPKQMYQNKKVVLAYLGLSNIMLGFRSEGRDLFKALDEKTISEDKLLSYMVNCGKIYLHYFDHDIPGMLKLANKIVDKNPERLASWNAGVDMILAKGETVIGEISSSNERLNKILSFSIRNDYPLLNLTSAVQLAINYIHLGDLEYAKTTCEKYIRQTTWNRYPLIGVLYAVLGDIQREQNDLDRSHKNILKAREFIDQVGGIGALGWIELAYFRIHFARGKYSECSDILENFDYRLRSTDAPPWLWDGLFASRIKLWNDTGEFERINSFIKEQEQFFSSEIGFSNFQSHLELIHFETLTKNRFKEHSLSINTKNKLSEAISLAFESKWIDLLIRCQIERVILESSEGNFEEAFNALEIATKNGARGNYLRVFLENWEHLKGLFTRTEMSLSQIGYLQTVFEKANIKTSDYISAKPLISEPLTSRELDILNRLDSVYSIPEIAQTLGVAPSTVRTHIKHIFSKLSVHSRIEAVHAAKELNIL